MYCMYSTEKQTRDSRSMELEDFLIFGYSGPYVKDWQVHHTYAPNECSPVVAIHK